MKTAMFILRNAPWAALGLVITFAVNRYEEPFRGCSAIGGEMFIAPMLVLTAELVYQFLLNITRRK